MPRSEQKERLLQRAQYDLDHGIPWSAKFCEAILALARRKP